jgi:hypothetical protein
MATWTFSGFDWSRYRAVAPQLRRAVQSGDLKGVREQEAADIIASLDPATNPAMACNCVISELCSVGAPVVFRGTLPAFLRTLGARVPGEEAADIIGEAAFAGSNIESWFHMERGLVGILTWSSLDHLKSHLEAYCREIPEPPRPSGIARLVGKLKPGEGADTLLEDLVGLVNECVASRLGLAVVYADD